MFGYDVFAEPRSIRRMVNRVSVEAQRNVYLQRYAFSFMNPYFTDDGLSLGYNLWWREFDNSEFNTAQYSSTNAAGQMVLGLPITGANVARAMQLSPPTVHEMIGRLERDGYITRREDKTVEFTAGALELIAKRALKRDTGAG